MAAIDGVLLLALHLIIYLYQLLHASQVTVALVGIQREDVDLLIIEHAYGAQVDKRLQTAHTRPANSDYKQFHNFI